jgi:molybdopterin/thiamine biosynthesis adenylyltransferase
MKVQIITPEFLYLKLRRKLFPPGDDRENFAFALAGVSRHLDACNLLLRHFIAADGSCLVKQSGVRVSPDQRFVTYAWTLAKASNSVLIHIHTHPFSDNYVGFSGIDDVSDTETFPKMVEFLGNGPHTAIVLGQNCLDARWYDPQSKTLKPVAAVKILGERLLTILPSSAHSNTLYREDVVQTQANEIYDRQIRVFGKEGQKALRQLTVAIVGAGGIGSVVFVQLVRLGVGCIIIIDPDVVEHSNLNRLAASTLKDADSKTPKVKMMAKYAARINPHIKIIPVQASILEEETQEYLKLADAFFGCLDNNAGRWVLNRLSATCLIPYFDTGTGIQATAEQNIEHAGGQVRIVIPGMGCLNCIKGIDIGMAQQELLPEPDRQIAIQRGYIKGADIPAPAVGPPNGIVANLAVTEFMAFVTGFKPLKRYLFYDFLNAKVVGFNFEKDPDCFTCSNKGLLAIGSEGTALPAEMLLDEPEPKEKIEKGEQKMATQNSNIRQSIQNLLTTAQQQGLDIEGNADGQWFLIRGVKTGRPFNKPKTDVMVKFVDESRDPIIFVPENLDIVTDNQVCQNFLDKTLYIKGWKTLCLHIFQDVIDDMLAFVSCLTGFMANPSLCGLMGCEGRALAKRQE